MSLVGVRVSIGASGARNCPSQVILGGRLHVLPAPSAKRWYSLQMTPAEALAAAPDTPMQASTSCNLISCLQGKLPALGLLELTAAERMSAYRYYYIPSAWFTDASPHIQRHSCQAECALPSTKIHQQTSTLQAGLWSEYESTDSCLGQHPWAALSSTALLLGLQAPVAIFV